jgi:ABC-2 type transport system permease protein
VSVWSLLLLAHPIQMIGFLIGSIPLYMLWALPTIGWLMLCSSWARTKPFLWAVVIPVAIGAMISWFHLLSTESFNSLWFWRDIVGRILFSVFPGGWLHDAAATQLSKDPSSISGFFSLGNSYAVLTAKNIWIGAAAGIAMLAGAVWFRRWRSDG